MDVDTIPAFLQDQEIESAMNLEGAFSEFEDQWRRRQWHQLTSSLVEFYKDEESAPQRLTMYNNFVIKFADKINQLKLVAIALSTSTQCRDDKERLVFLQTLVTRVDKPSSQDAFVFAITELGRVKLSLEDLTGARADLGRAGEMLDSLDSVDNVVHASFYRVNADYYGVKQDFTLYYRNALLYLACVQLSDLSQEDRHRRAYTLGIAALLSDKIYNFGELLLHPLLESLKKTPEAWLGEMLFAFNRGDLNAFQKLSHHIKSEPSLANHKTFLYQKIHLAALTEAVFQRPPHDRALPFSTIAHEAKVKNNEIEPLIMKALSLGLLKGTIDEVDQLARIHWVQPKVLDMGQIKGMRSRLAEWDDSVDKLGTWMESLGRDVWAA